MGSFQTKKCASDIVEAGRGMMNSDHVGKRGRVSMTLLWISGSPGLNHPLAALMSANPPEVLL